MSELLDKFEDKKVLAVYRCGSSLYGLNSCESDNDYTVILKDDYHPDIVKDEDGDYFVFGLKQFKEALSFKNGILSCFLVYLDNVTLAKDNLVFIDESFKDEFEQIIKIDWKPVFKKWLERNLSYFGIRLQNDPEEKSLYTLYKLDSIVRHYKKTGVFKSYFTKENLALADDFKLCPEHREEHKERLQEIFSYLESIFKEE